MDNFSPAHRGPRTGNRKQETGHRIQDTGYSEQRTAHPPAFGRVGTTEDRADTGVGNIGRNMIVDGQELEA